MKTLYLLRHAKSSWEFEREDIDRPLSPRGARACELMAREIQALDCNPEIVFSSPALRARQTIEGVSQAFAGNLKAHIDDDLYTFSYRDLMTWCRALPERFSRVLVVGHNPAVTELVNALSGQEIENVPTCGYVHLSLDKGQWCSIYPGTMQLEHYVTPKQVKRRIKLNKKE